jgi:cell division protein FtsL
MKILQLGLLIIALSSTFLFYVWGKADVVRVGYELDQLSKKKMVLDQEHDRLQISFSQLTATDRIAQEASRQLKMRPPAPGQVILVAGGFQKAPEQNKGLLRVAQQDLSVGTR